MPQNHVTIYTMVETGIDIDHGTFPNPQARGSYLSFERANEVLEQLAIEEKAKLDERCDQEDRGENYWEAYANGYASALFARLDILSAALDMTGGQ